MTIMPDTPKQYETFGNKSTSDKTGWNDDNWFSASISKWWWVLSTCLAACIATWCTCGETEVIMITSLESDIMQYHATLGDHFSLFSRLHFGKINLSLHSYF